MARWMDSADMAMYRVRVEIRFPETLRKPARTEERVYGPYRRANTAASVGGRVARDWKSWQGTEVRYSVERASTIWTPVP